MAEIVTAFGLVAAAAVTGIFSLIAQRFRHENTEQHARGQVEDLQ